MSELNLDDDLFPEETEQDEQLAYPEGASEEAYDKATEVAEDFLTPVRLSV